MRLAYVAAGAVVIGATVSEARSVTSSPKPITKRQNHQNGLPIQPLKFRSSHVQSAPDDQAVASVDDLYNKATIDDAQITPAQPTSLPAGLEATHSQPVNAETLQGQLQALLESGSIVPAGPANFPQTFPTSYVTPDMAYGLWPNMPAGLPGADRTANSLAYAKNGVPAVLPAGSEIFGNARTSLDNPLSTSAKKSMRKAGDALPTSGAIDRSVFDAVQGAPSMSDDIVYVVANSANSPWGKVIQLPAGSIALPQSPIQNNAQPFFLSPGTQSAAPVLSALRFTHKHHALNQGIDPSAMVSTPSTAFNIHSAAFTPFAKNSPPPPAYRAVQSGSESPSNSDATKNSIDSPDVTTSPDSPDNATLGSTPPASERSVQNQNQTNPPDSTVSQSSAAPSPAAVTPPENPENATSSPAPPATDRAVQGGNDTTVPSNSTASDSSAVSPSDATNSSDIPANSTSLVNPPATDRAVQGGNDTAVAPTPTASDNSTAPSPANLDNNPGNSTLDSSPTTVAPQE